MPGRRKTSPERSIQSVDRALQILRFIASNDNCAPLTAISAGIGLSNSTTHGLISTLRQNGFVDQDKESGKYSLGMALFEMGRVVQRSMNLPAITRPVFQQLSDKYGETLHLAVLVDEEIMYIEKLDSTRSVRMISLVGGRNPAYCTGIGKVLLAGLADSELDSYLATHELRRYTPYTITDRAELRNNLIEIRRNGYGQDEEEIELGLRCVACPIKNHRGATVAAISIAIPTNRLLEEELPVIIEDMKKAARDISRKLGYPG